MYLLLWPSIVSHAEYYYSNRSINSNQPLTSLSNYTNRIDRVQYRQTIWSNPTNNVQGLIPSWCSHTNHIPRFRGCCFSIGLGIQVSTFTSSISSSSSSSSLPTVTHSNHHKSSWLLQLRLEATGWRAVERFQQCSPSIHSTISGMWLSSESSYPPPSVRALYRTHLQRIKHHHPAVIAPKHLVSMQAD